jgi:hypothetical protein
MAHQSHLHYTAVTLTATSGFPMPPGPGAITMASTIMSFDDFATRFETEEEAIAFGCVIARAWIDDSV